MLYKVIAEAEFKSDLPIEYVKQLLQFALVNEEGNEIVIDHKFSDKFSIREYHRLEIEEVTKE